MASLRISCYKNVETVVRVGIHIHVLYGFNMPSFRQGGMSNTAWWGIHICTGIAIHVHLVVFTWSGSA